MEVVLKTKGKLYRELFLSTFKLSAFTIGGGYVIVPLMRKRFVEELGWIDEREMLDLISVSQSSPGPIAVNASLMVGYRMAGIAGALITALGTVLPPFLVISVVSLFYQQFRANQYINIAMVGMQAGVAAIICNVVLDMGLFIIKDKNWISTLIMIAVFVAVFFFKVNIFWVILSCGLIGLITGGIRKSKSQTRQEEEREGDQ